MNTFSGSAPVVPAHTYSGAGGSTYTLALAGGTRSGQEAQPLAESTQLQSEVTNQGASKRLE